MLCICNDNASVDNQKRCGLEWSLIAYHLYLVKCHCGQCLLFKQLLGHCIILY